jgi:steroid 5-alpha reductase family enzyme
MGYSTKLAPYTSRLNKNYEDFRYAVMRSHTKRSFVFRSLWTVFYLQGTLIILIGTPIVIIMSESQSYHWIHFIGFMVWCTGFYLEWEADRSLMHAKNQGIKLMTQGVWSLSRHPNYLGDACVWWGIAFMAYGSSYFIIALLSAALMNFFLRKVSDVPLLEKRMAHREGWQDYQANTPIFWPTPRLLLKKLFK